MKTPSLLRRNIAVACHVGILYAIVGACWLPVVWLQWRAHRLAQHAASRDAPLPVAYHRCIRNWFLLGSPAFVGVLVIFWLMVAKLPVWS